MNDSEIKVIPTNVIDIPKYPTLVNFSLKNKSASITVNNISPPPNTEASEAVVLFNPSKYKNGAIPAPINPISNRIA